MEIPAAQAALAEAGPPGQEPGADFSEQAAAAAIALVRALLRNRPFPQQNQQVAVAAGLQFLSLNRWRADLDPAATTAVVVEALASGRLAPVDAVAWLSPRLSPAPRSDRRHRVGRTLVSVPRFSPRLPRLLPAAPAAVGRVAASTLLAATVGGVAVLAACSRAPDMSAAAARPPAVRQSPAVALARTADLAYAACMRTHGIEDFPDPSASGVAAIIPATGIDPDSPEFSSAEHTCQVINPTAIIRIVTADAAT
jgi:prophage maintenance system killer protein